ncbi:MAG TPA: hypothetical protein VIA64_06700 [Burkholderiales bacterium]|jgi:hypothetical protein
MPELSMHAAQQGTPADITKFAYANLAPRLSLGVRRHTTPRGVSCVMAVIGHKPALAATED